MKFQSSINKLLIMAEIQNKKTFEQLKEIQKLIRRESSLKGLYK